MSKSELQHQETLLTEALLSALDARESARAAEAAMAVYLADLLVQRTRDDLSRVRAQMAEAENPRKQA